MVFTKILYIPQTKKKKYKTKQSKKKLTWNGCWHLIECK